MYMNIKATQCLTYMYMYTHAHTHVQLNAVQTLVGLLSHDNSDIALAVVDLFQELTDVDTLNESEEEVERLIEALLGEQVGRGRGCKDTQIGRAHV